MYAGVGSIKYIKDEAVPIEIYSARVSFSGSARRDYPRRDDRKSKKHGSTYG